MDEIRFGRRAFLRSMVAGSAALGMAAHGARGLVAASYPPAQAAVPTRALAALARDLPGRVLLPGDPAWAELTYQSNARWLAPGPVALALPERVEEIATCVRWARQEGAPFAVRAGGHNYAGHSATTGLAISTIRLKSATLDDRTGILDAGAGVQNRDLEVVQRGDGSGRWILPGGTCRTVAITGLTLGGGIGPNARWAGLTADHLVETTLVTADGEIVTASAVEHPDLFWALRGIGGGQLGIHASHRYALAEVPVATAHSAGIRATGPAALAALAERFREMFAGAPRTMSGTLSCRSDAEAGAIGTAWLLLAEPEARALDRIADLTVPGAEVVHSVHLPWWDAQADWLEDGRPPHPYWDRSRYVPADLAPGVLTDLVARLGRFPADGGPGAAGQLVVYAWVGGAVADVARDATAYVHRDAPLLLRVSGVWDEAAPAGPDGYPGIPAVVRGWVEETWAAALPHLLPESYQNFPDPELADWEDAYYAENLGRLRAVKAAWDPEDRFRHEQSILPA